MRTSSIFGAAAITFACAACGEEAAPRAENDASATDGSVDATSADASDSTIDSAAESSGDSAVVDDATIEAADGDAVVANPRDLDAIVYAMFDSNTKTSHVWKAYPDAANFGNFVDAVDLTPWSPDGSYVDAPSWSRDRAKIYCGHRVGSSILVAVMNADGSDFTDLPPGTPYGVPTPDGHLVVVRLDDKTHSHLAVTDAAGQNEVPITSTGFEDFGFTVSPDGRHVAFTTNRPDASSAKTSIYVVDIDGSNLHPLVTSQGGDDYPAWSPKGDRIAFRRSYLILNDAGDTVLCIGNDIWSVAPDGTALTNLTNLVGSCAKDDQIFLEDYDQNPVWSPDATSIFFVDDHRRYDRSTNACPPDCAPRHVEKFEVLMMKADGSELTEVTGLGVPPDPPEDCSGNTPAPDAGPSSPCTQPTNPVYLVEPSW